MAAECPASSRMNSASVAGCGAHTLKTPSRSPIQGRLKYLSWLHWEDMNRVFEAALDGENLEGVFNVCAPQPATNAEFMRELRRVSGGHGARRCPFGRFAWDAG